MPIQELARKPRRHQAPDIAALDRAQQRLSLNARQGCADFVEQAIAQ